MSQKTVKFAHIGGGLLNRATKLMAGLAHDTALLAHVSRCYIDNAAAERNAKISARFADVKKGTIVI